jgi:hypothetical protein
LLPAAAVQFGDSFKVFQVGRDDTAAVAHGDGRDGNIEIVDEFSAAFHFSVEFAEQNRRFVCPEQHGENGKQEVLFRVQQEEFFFVCPMRCRPYWISAITGGTVTMKRTMWDIGFSCGMIPHAIFLFS